MVLGSSEWRGHVDLAWWSAAIPVSVGSSRGRIVVLVALLLASIFLL